MPCPTVKSSFDYRFLAMVITQQFTELFHGHSNQYSTEKISHSQTNIKSLNASILLKLRTVENNNARNYREFSTNLHNTWKVYSSSSARIHFHSASPYIIDESVIPIEVSGNKSKSKQDTFAFCHLFSVILYEDRSVCAVNVMHKKCFFFCTEKDVLSLSQ